MELCVYNFCNGLFKEVTMNISFVSVFNVTKQCQKSILLRTLCLDKNSDFLFRRFCSKSPSIWSSQYITSKDKNVNENRNSLFKNKIHSNNLVTRRNYCSTPNPPARKLPPLMKFPEIVWPSLLKSLRNFILTNFIIKPYFDREFNLPDFINGSKKAVEVCY